MLHEREIKKWRRWLKIENSRLENKGYKGTPKYNENLSQIYMINIILNNERCIDELHEM